MNMFKKNGGFTLVELIVVIAILAILAGVAVPAYTGYIAKAQQASALQTLSSVNTAAQGLAVAEGATVTKITVTSSDDKITVTISGGEEGASITQGEIEELTGTLDFDTKVFSTATWENGEWDLAAPVKETTPAG